MNNEKLKQRIIDFSKDLMTFENNPFGITVNINKEQVELTELMHRIEMWARQDERRIFLNRWGKTLKEFYINELGKLNDLLKSWKKHKSVPERVMQNLRNEIKSIEKELKDLKELMEGLK